MRIALLIISCGFLSANICEKIAPDLYDAAVLNTDKTKIYDEVLPSGYTRPELGKAQLALDEIKSLQAKCALSEPGAKPDDAAIKKSLNAVLDSVNLNDKALQKNDIFKENALNIVRDDAIFASTKLQRLLLEILEPSEESSKGVSPSVTKPAPVAAKPAATKNDAEKKKEQGSKEKVDGDETDNEDGDDKEDSKEGENEESGDKSEDNDQDKDKDDSDSEDEGDDENEADDE